MTTLARQLAITVAAVALAAGVLSSEVRASGLCDKKTCKPEFNKFCHDLPGGDAAEETCKAAILSNCRTTDCSCDGSTPTQCTPGPTTISTTSTTTMSTTTSTTSSTTSVRRQSIVDHVRV
jgi:hypothetical protein